MSVPHVALLTLLVPHVALLTLLVLQVALFLICHFAEDTYAHARLADLFTLDCEWRPM